MFKKKNELQKLINKDGLPFATKRFSEIVNDMIPSINIAEQFVLEEIEAASQGNDDAMRFAFNSGYTPEEYKGSMQNSCTEVDGPEGPQQLLLGLSMQLYSDVDLMVKFRTMIVDEIMKTWGLGKY